MTAHRAADRLQRPGTPMSILVPFVPWIVFLGVATVADWRVALVAGLVTQLTVLVSSRSRRPGILDAGMLVFLSAMCVYAFVAPESPLQDQVSNVMSIWLGAVAALSLLVGHPFTVDFSAAGQPDEVVRSELFLRINRMITAVWAAALTAMGVGGLIGQATGHPGIGTAATVLGLVYAIRFTRTYPDRAIAKAVPSAALAE